MKLLKMFYKSQIPDTAKKKQKKRNKGKQNKAKESKVKLN
jgi:hypothetical protein